MSVPMSSASDDDVGGKRETRESVQMITTADEYGGRASAPPPERLSEARSEQLLHPGDVVADRYRIDSEIGRGGMGIVYAATMLASGRRVALKWLFESAANRGERRRRFLREARAASTVEHASVVRVFDAGEHARGVFLAMELLQGESLRVHLLRSNLNVQQAVDLLMPVLRGIAAAHQQGVIHRDLKPDNMLVCPRAGGAPEIKVLDFGLSKLIGNDGDSLHTLPGAMLGTPQYMAPEQIEGSGRVDARCDLYSIAAILYEAIAGRRPFESLTLADLLAKLSREEPPPLRQVARAFNKDVPQAFSQAVMRALNRDPAKRYDTVEDFALAIEPFGTLEFHSTVAARDAYAETLRGRRNSKRFALPRSPLLKPVALVWLAAITIVVGWLAVRVLMQSSADPELQGVHVATPAKSDGAPKPLPKDVTLLPAAEHAPVERPKQAPAEIAPAEIAPAEIAPAPSSEPSRRLAPRPRAARKPGAATAPTKLTKTDIVDPWQ
jgi:hypothetical protein